MQTESNVKPIGRFDILPLNDRESEVLFYENVETIPAHDEEPEKYTYDMYRLVARSREYLPNLIDLNYDAWLAKAKEQEIRDSIKIPTLEDRLKAVEDVMLGLL